MSVRLVSRGGSFAIKKNHRLSGGLFVEGNLFHSCVRMSSSKIQRFRSWPVPMVESHGDYSQEAFLECHIGGPLYENQSMLPPLPVPSLEETCEKFLPTALPLAESQEEAQTLINACRAFPHEAKDLQRRLELRATNECRDSSWLQLWWNTLAYLQFREPVVINVSYFFQLAPQDPTILLSSSNTTDLYIRRAATALVAVADYRKLVCSGQLPCETIGRPHKIPLCSTAFKYLFHACRIPQPEQDSYRIYDPSRHTHCIVACQGQFFAVDFVDPDTGDALPIEILQHRLERCVRLAEKESNDDHEDASIKLGWLTSSDRDSWSNSRTELIRIGDAQMEAALTLLESGAFLLCLDSEDPVSRNECGETYWHGGKSSGFNRWFDKSVQIVCTKGGKLGFIGEHSMMDGMPAVGLCSHILNTTYADVINRNAPPLYTSNSQDESGVKSIFKNVMPLLKTAEGRNVVDAVVKAEADFEKLTSSQEICLESFQGYGRDKIKEMGYSPDAYVQMAIQLATYRLFGKQVGTYEAVQVRPFLHGRTETCRSVSLASSRFVRYMGLRPKANDPASHSQKVALLKEAITRHVTYLGNAGQGMGVDRHLFGLSMLVNDQDKESSVPQLLSHPVFERSKKWRVSTSTLPNSPGFGEVVPDGVGIGYEIKPNACIFTVTALKENNWTERLCHLLEEALLEMRLLNDEHDKSIRRSKL